VESLLSVPPICTRAPYSANMVGVWKFLHFLGPRVNLSFAFPDRNGNQNLMDVECVHWEGTKWSSDYVWCRE